MLHSNEFSIWDCNIWKSGPVWLPVRNQGMCFIKRLHCTKVRWAELWRGFHQRHDYVLFPIQKSLSSRDEKKNPYTDRLRNIWSSEGNRTNISKLKNGFLFKWVNLCNLDTALRGIFAFTLHRDCCKNCLYLVINTHNETIDNWSSLCFWFQININ